MSCRAEKMTWYFKVINHALRSKFDTILKDEGLTKVQFEVLVYVYEQTIRKVDVIQRDIEDHFQISNPSVSTMITRLEAKNLMAREPGDKDRRKRYVVLTPKAKTLVESMHRQVQNAEDLMLTDMDPALLDQGMKFLEQILYNLTGKEVADRDFDTR